MSTHFKIIIACRNVEKWLDCCLSSIEQQTYKNRQCILIDDASNDNTFSIANKHLNIQILRNTSRSLKIQNYKLVMDFIDIHNEDVLVFVDGDDWLSDVNVLDYLAKIYEQDIWITWGSFIEVDGKNPIVFGNYTNIPISKGPRPFPKGNNIRVGWRFSHLKTCKYFLWKNIKDESFRSVETHNYYEASIDCALMWPMLEMAGPEHSKYISRLLYVYNNNNPDSYMHRISNVQKQAFLELKRRKPYIRKTKKELL